MIPERDEDKLTEREQDRLDSLLSGARTFHHLSFVVACLVVVTAAVGGEQAFILPTGNIKLPTTGAALFGYATTTMLAAYASVLLKMALPYLRLDPRRPRFAWIMLGGEVISGVMILVLFLLPVLLAGLAAMTMLRPQLTGVQLLLEPSPFNLILVGFFLFNFPTYLQAQLGQIQSKMDEEGQPITLSVWLHYIMRVIRQSGLTLAAIATWASLIPAWRADGPRWVVWSVSISVGVWVLCLIAQPFCRYLDRWGVAKGFAASYESPDMKRKRQRARD